MKYIDANVFLYYILNPETDAKRLQAKKILTEVANGSVPAATCLLTWDEIVWAVRRLLSLETAKSEGAKFLEFPNLRLLEVKRNILSTAQEAVEKHHLNPRDAIHAACCLENGIDEIITDDADFRNIDGLARITLEDAAKSM